MFLREPHTHTLDTILQASQRLEESIRLLRVANHAYVYSIER
jgi:hypothetical protein